MLNIVKGHSPNFNEGRNGWTPDIIVNHITAGSYTSAINTFNSPKSEVSSHFITSKLGDVIQMVDLKNMAWCNGTTTNGDKRDYRKARCRDVRLRPTNANYYTISIEHENRGGGALTAPQLATTIDLHKHIISELKRIYGVGFAADRNHIIGHCDVNPVTKPMCPGVNFPFDAIIAALNPDVETLYVVKAGDGFWRIAKQQMGDGGAAAVLAQYNGLTINSVIHAGQTLKIPKK